MVASSKIEVWRAEHDLAFCSLDGQSHSSIQPTPHQSDAREKSPWFLGIKSYAFFSDITLKRWQMRYQNKKHEPSIVDRIALSSSIWESREGFNSQPTFLDRLSILFLNTTLARRSHWASQGIRNVAANNCGKKKTWVSTGLNQKSCPLTRSTKQSTCATEGAEKPINTSSTPGYLLYNLFTWPRKVEQAYVWGGR
jgi:hypothetical protein